LLSFLHVSEGVVLEMAFVNLANVFLLLDRALSNKTNHLYVGL
jgi:hypothetical protein